MRGELESLLGEIDRWAGEREVELDVYLLGGAVLRLYEGVGSRTKDLDIVREPLGEHAEDLANALGRESGRDPFVDLVSAGLPLLPVGWMERAQPQATEAQHLRVYRLAPSDHVASKLKAFRPHDRRDITVLCDLYPREVEEGLTRLRADDFWTAPDLWEDKIAPRRDRVLAWMRGESDVL